MKSLHKQIKELKEIGHTNTEISNILKCSLNTISHYYPAYRHNKTPKCDLSKEQIEEEYFTNNLSIRKIADKYDVNEKTITILFNKYDIPRKSRKKDLLGKTIGYYTVINELEPVYIGIHINYVWECRCLCGNVKQLTTRQLLSGDYVSCGCRRTTRHEDVSGEYIGCIRNRAKQGDIAFNITAEDVYNQFIKQNKKCYYSGLEIFFAHSMSATYSGKEPHQTASVDRFNSDLGYTTDNIVIVHKNVNLMKSSLTSDDFINFCCLISNNFPEHIVYTNSVDSYIPHKNTKQIEKPKKKRLNRSKRPKKVVLLENGDVNFVERNTLCPAN